MGRPRKPQALKILEGNRGKRKLTAEPKPLRGMTDPPKHLSDLGKKVWVTVSNELDRLGLIAIVDAQAFEGFCVAYSRAVEADISIAENGLWFEVSGMRYQRPEVGISSHCWKQVKSFCTEFGLTPASRGKLVVGDTGKQIDPVAEALYG